MTSDIAGISDVPFGLLLCLDWQSYSYSRKQATKLGQDMQASNGASTLGAHI